MRYIDDADTLFFQRFNNTEQPIDLFARQRGRRFVHDQNLRIRVKRLCDFDHLLLRHLQIADNRIRRDVVHLQFVEHFLRALFHLPFVEHGTSTQFPSQKNILRDCQMPAHI